MKLMVKTQQMYKITVVIALLLYEPAQVGCQFQMPNVPLHKLTPELVIRAAENQERKNMAAKAMMKKVPEIKKKAVEAFATHCLKIKMWGVWDNYVL